MGLPYAALSTGVFGGAKESISPSGARTRFKNRRDNDTNN